MIFRLTVEDNDFTHIIYQYFMHRSNVFQYQLFKVLHDRDILHKYMVSIEEQSDKIIGMLSNKPTPTSKDFLTNVLRLDIIDWLIDQDLDETTTQYIISRIKITVHKSFTPKDENGEALYVYITTPGAVKFNVIQ